ncbi:MAG: metal-sensitive transcriptional regulator [Candidatus Dojkabacteria bacterium]|nr:metal-sensitive transcriptional regulator [Candidatus Dojkabacteria bacterium]MDQ7020917.1 metal-sensitive transcriptional regulator [Candidatus Dojkabacteria bacterium]
MKELENRVNRIIGQLESVKKEITKENYDCGQIVQQVKAISGSIKSFGKAFAEEDIKACMNKDLSKEEIKERLETILDVAFKY